LSAEAGVRNQVTTDKVSSETEDHYSTRLAAVNEDHDVVSSEDIVNKHGTVLVKSGMRIDRNMADLILRHKLVKPLDQSVSVANELDGNRLADATDLLFIKYTDLRCIHDATNFSGLWRQLTERTPLPPVLRQKLTVLRHQMPSEYEKCLFTAWLSALVARDMYLPDRQIVSAFFAGLGHDLGLLHIDPEILNKKGPLTAPEWRAIQSHVVVGKMMMESISGVDADVPKAILEHHERCDGTGYPVGKVEQNLDPLGLVVGLADSLQAIRVKQFQSVGRNLFDAMPYLYMNSHTYSYPVFRAISSILKRSGLSASDVNPYGNDGELLERLRGRGQALHNIVEEIDTLVNELENLSRTRRGQDLLKSLSQVRSMIISSGVVRPELLSWLSGLDGGSLEKGAAAELIEIDLMLNELRWQLKNLLNAFNVFYERECESEEAVCQPIKHAMARLISNLADA
jgi:HD-GYP domain-containing protein (c-di-GMP phosphodiesterase class II)